MPPSLFPTLLTLIRSRGRCCYDGKPTNATVLATVRASPTLDDTEGRWTSLRRPLPPSSLRFTGDRHCTALHRRTPSTPTRSHPLLPKPHGQFLLSLSLSSSRVSLGQPTRSSWFILSKSEVPIDLLLGGPKASNITNSHIIS